MGIGNGEDEIFLDHVGMLSSLKGSLKSERPKPSDEYEPRDGSEFSHLPEVFLVVRSETGPGGVW